MRDLSGDNNPNWNGGKPICLFCGQQTVHYGIKRCRKCWRESVSRKEESERRTREGYVLLWLPNHPVASKKSGQMKGWYQKHRYVVESRIGRVLRSTEVVHHINGIKNDNRIENLQLVSSNANHMSIEQKGKPKSEGFREKMRIIKSLYWENKRNAIS